MRPLTICLTGDIYPTRRLSPVPPKVERVFSVLHHADLTIGNFEIPLSDRGDPLEKLLTIRAQPELASDLHVIGLDVATLANNHAVDYGWSALEQTADLLRDAGIRVVGLGSSLAEALEPVILTTNGVRVGVLGLSCLLPTGMAAAESRPGIAPLHVDTAYQVDPSYQMEEPGDISAITVRTTVRSDDLERAKAAIANMKSRCDIAAVSLHWGFGSTEALAEYQNPLAKALIEAGADIIHGHHPHAVQGIGFHLGKPIIFSMNVLIGQQVFLPASEAVKTMWSEMSIDGYVACARMFENGTIEIEAFPTLLGPDRLPVFAEGVDFDRIHTKLARLSAQHGAFVTREGDTLRIASSGR